MKKRILALFLGISLLLAAIPVGALASEEAADGSAEYLLSEEGSGIDAVRPLSEKDAVFEKHAAKAFEGEVLYSNKWFGNEENGYTAKLRYAYDDNWLKGSAYTYNHDLAKMSQRIAAASNGTYENGSADNLLKLLDELEYTYTDESVNYPTPETDTIGSVISAKNIAFYDGSEATVVMVTVRSGEYGSEWGGNFHVGAEGDHVGFSIAAETVLERIGSFLTNNRANFKEDIKIWLAGYSRGAAVSNLLAAYLDQGRIKGIDPEDVFAFCFECPENNVDIPDRLSSLYGNITTVINPADLVTKVAPSAWNMGWYGHICYLPAAANTASYETLKKAMDSAYKELYHVNGKTDSDYESDKPGDFAPEQSAEMDDLVDILAAVFRDREYYVEGGGEAALGKIATKYLGGKKMSTFLLLLNLVSDLTSTPALTTPISELMNDHSETFNRLLDMIRSNALQHGHYPELCMAWMEALDEDTLMSIPSSFRKVYLEGNADLAVYTKAGKQVAGISGTTVSGFTGGVGAYVDDEGQKVVLLPEDESYEVRITPKASENITYTIWEYDYNMGTGAMLESWIDVSVDAGQMITGSVAENTSEFTLNGPKGAILPSILRTAGEADRCHVTVLAEGNGKVRGGCLRPEGTYTTVKAAADDGAEFYGWYIDGKCVSKDAEYRYLIGESVELVAKFTGAVIDDPDTPAVEANRIYGTSRTDTAVEIAKASFEKAESVVLASSLNYADALAGAPLAYAMNAPILLVGKSLDANTQSEIAALGAKNVYILGGTAAVGQGVEDTLTGKGYQVERVEGYSRYDTAAAIAKKLEEVTGKKATEAFIASGVNFPDALAVSSIAAIKGTPILYAAANGKLNGTESYLKDKNCKVESCVILGGEVAVGKSAADNLKACGVTKVDRIEGHSRYDTCLAINEEYAEVLEGDELCVATGTNYPDALAGGVYAAIRKSPVFLVGKSIDTNQAAYVAKFAPVKITVFGGPVAVSDAVVEQILEAAK